MGKYDHLKGRVEQMLDQSKTVTEICATLDIPVGSITYVLRKWGLEHKQVRHTGRYSKETREKWSQTWKGIHESGISSGENHWHHGRWKVRGEMVSPEEIRAELESYVDQDLTIAKMAEAMGVSPRTITKHLKHFGLQQGLRSGERCPWWEGGHKVYRGPDWKTVRLEALKRDKYACCDCGATMKECILRGHALNVHHKVPYRETQDNTLNNLITLCQSCHMVREKNNAG
jgi:DNA-binding transcriptional ArsR family regulator